jgi:hypothetical protein
VTQILEISNKTINQLFKKKVFQWAIANTVEMAGKIGSLAKK